MVEPRNVHLVVEKHVMRYLKGTLECGLKYTTDSEFILCSYTDLDWEEVLKIEITLQDVVWVWDHA